MRKVKVSCHQKYNLAHGNCSHLKDNKKPQQVSNAQKPCNNSFYTMGLATEMINVDNHIMISKKWNLRTQIHIKCLPKCTVKVSVSLSLQNGLSTQQLNTASFHIIFNGGNKKQKHCSISLITPGSLMSNSHFVYPYMAAQSPP